MHLLLDLGPRVPLHRVLLLLVLLGTAVDWIYQMISITRLLELKKDLAIMRAYKSIPPTISYADWVESEENLGDYADILEDYLRLQQGSA